MELRHLRYFTAVVRWMGYREASRRLHIAQPSLSQAVADLEGELGIKLFARNGRNSTLTREGQAFYEEALKTLAQAEHSVAVAQRVAKGEIGNLGIGFMGFAAYPFLSCLIREYKARYPGIALRLEEDVPSGQLAAFDRGEIDIAFTRPLPAERRSCYETRLLFREPLVVALPRSRKLKTKRVNISDLAGEPFNVFRRESSPEVFDAIVRVCTDNGFSPKLQNELNNMNSVLSTVEAGEGISIVPASAQNIRADNICFYRLNPDNVRIDFIAAWQKREPSVPLKLFLDLLKVKLPNIRKKTCFSDSVH